MNQRDIERRRMMEHEERMRRSPKELFFEDHPMEQVMCKGCHHLFKRRSDLSVKRRFCSTMCKSKYIRANRRAA